MTPSFEAAILAGGRSRRMGRSKALLAVPGTGQPLIARQAQLLGRLGPARLLLSCRPRQRLPALSGAVRVPDAWPDAGPLGGIASCLQACREPLLLVLATDLPAITAAPLRRLLALSGTGCGAVFREKDRLQPLVAVYPREALPLAEEFLAAGCLRMQEWTSACLRHGLLTETRLPAAWSGAFRNWNRPVDLRPPSSPS